MKKRILLISCLSFTLVTAGISVNVFSENETTVSAIERVIPWYEEYAEETSVSDVLDGLGESYMLIPFARLNPETQNIYPASNTSLVITETDLKQITELSYKYKVYSASTLQLDQINQELEKYSVELSQSKDDENIYETSEIHDLTLKKEIAEILSKFEHVNRIDETSEVSLKSEGFVGYVYTKSDLEKDQIIEKYSKYGLEIKNIKENDDGNKKYIYYFKFSQFIGTGISDVEYQKRLNELLDDRDIKIDFAFYAETSDSNQYSKTIYQACSSDKNFDINDDGKSDVTDLSMLSLYLIGDLTLNDNQLITADIDSDGTVTLADLARLQQYLSKKITAF